MISRHIIPALAAFGAVNAATSSANDACSSDTVTINSQADASQYSSCSSLKKVVIGSGASAQPISLDGPKTIDSLTAESSVLTSLGSTSITVINNQFVLNNLTALSTVSFSKLDQVGDLTWTSLPVLSAVTMASGGITSAKSVTISDTQLPNVDAFVLETVQTLDINNNIDLNDISLMLRNVTSSISLSANGNNLVVDLPMLTSAANMSISNVTSFSAAGLASVSGTMNFKFNYFTNFSAPNMTSTGSGDINFSDNAFLSNLSFPSLTAVGGGFQIINNTALYHIDEFPKLKTVGGSAQLRGNFTDVELPALNSVSGGFVVYSTSDISANCTTFDDLKKSGKIKGSPYNCTSFDATANSGGNSGTSSSGSDGGGSSSGDNKDGAASGVAINTGMALALAAVGIIAQML